MTDQFNPILTIYISLSWLAGIVLAKGFWLTSLACVFPPYAGYLCVEKAMQMLGLI